MAHTYKLAQRHSCVTCLRLFERHGPHLVDGAIVHDELTPGQWLGNRPPVSYSTPVHVESASPVRVSGKTPRVQRKLKAIGGEV